MLVQECNQTGIMTHPGCTLLHFHCVHYLISLDIVNFRQASKLLYNAVREATCIAFDMTIIDVSDARFIGSQRIGLVRHLQEPEVVLPEERWQVLLKHDDIRIVNRAMGVLRRHDERCERQRRALTGYIVRSSG